MIEFANDRMIQKYKFDRMYKWIFARYKFNSIDVLNSEYSYLSVCLHEKWEKTG